MMPYTTREVAKMLDVTPQRINQIIQGLKEEDKPNKEKGVYIFTDQNIEAVKNYAGDKQAISKAEALEQLSNLKLDFKNIQKELNEKTIELEVAKSAVSSKEKQIKDQAEQLATKDKQIDAANDNIKLQGKLVDQAQQLQLQTLQELNQAKEHIKQLEDPKQANKLDIKNDQSESTSNPDTPTDKPKKRKWWPFG